MVLATELPPSSGRRQLAFVAAPQAMSTRHFALHMSMRHEDSLGGLTGLPDNLSPETEALWRALHDRLHRVASGLTAIAELSCGHVALTKHGVAKGSWVSCWALMAPRDGCQTSVKVVRVAPAETVPDFDHEHEGS